MKSKIRMWNYVSKNPHKSKFIYDINIVMECLKQQMLFDSGSKNLLAYDHVGNGSLFQISVEFAGYDEHETIFEGDVLRAKYNRFFHIMPSGTKIECVGGENNIQEECEEFIVIEKKIGPNFCGYTLPTTGGISYNFCNNDVIKWEKIGNICENPELKKFIKIIET